MNFQRTIIFIAVILAIAVAAFLLELRFSLSSELYERTEQQPGAPFAEEPTGPAPQPSSSSTPTAKVPIIVYHIVRPSYPSDDPGVRAIAVTPQTFDAELAHLADAGYHVIGFRVLESHFAAGAPLPVKPVILSFDDGWSDQYDYAFPILEKYHDPATFFVFTNSIGRRGFMTWDDLKNLTAAGMTIGDHTKSHPFLTKITDPRKLWEEIDGSKLLLESRLGVSITEFAYPFGQYNPDILTLVQQAGYKSARGDYWKGNTQSSDHLYELSAVNAPTTTAAFIKRFP